MGAETFDGRVRDGIGSGCLAWATRPAKAIVLRLGPKGLPSPCGSMELASAGAEGAPLRLCGSGERGGFGSFVGLRVYVGSTPRGGWPRTMRAIKPDERLVPVSCTGRPASTPGLSTWWSSTALQGELVSRWVSSLDAFSSYPVRT